MPANLFGRQFTALLYSRTASNVAAYDMASAGGGQSLTSRLGFHMRWTDNTTYFDAFNTSDERMSASTTNSQGLFDLTRNGVTGSIYRNGTSLVSATKGTGATIPTANILFGADPGGSSGATGASGRQYALLAFLPNIAPAIKSAVYTVIQNYETILNRNV